MSTVIIRPLIENPEFSFGEKKVQAFLFSSVAYLLKQALKIDHSMISNLKVAAPAQGHYIASFFWHGEYEGVVVFEIIIHR